MTNVQLTLIFSKYLVQFRFSFSIISQIQPFSHTEKHGLKKEYETLPYPYDKTVHFCPLESKKQKESIPLIIHSK